jgi:hypothetical protein
VALAAAIAAVISVGVAIRVLDDPVLSRISRRSACLRGIRREAEGAISP